MKLALIGLGRMGGNMARRLRQHDIDVVGYNRNPAVTNELAESDGVIAAGSVEAAIASLPAPRVVWLMLPAGAVTEQHIETITPLLSSGDVLVNGANANYHDSQRHAAALKKQGIHFVDAGVSGGVWGLKNGYCLMVGGDDEAIQLLEPALKALAPAEDRGWAHVGPAGAGHFTKMVHNGVEYGMMQAIAEGFALMKGKSDFNLDMAQISELWRHGSVVQSWLLDLTADFLQNDQQLDDIAAIVADSGEGRWTAIEAIDQGTPAPVISLALAMRFASQDDNSYAHRMLAMMRKGFGGHAVNQKQE